MSYSTKDISTLIQKTEAGDACTQYAFGRRLRDGTDVPKDEAAAMKWFLLAADQGHASAQCYLGWCYEAGVGMAN